MVLKVNEASDAIISEMIASGLGEYFRFVAEKLDCCIDDLCYLDVHPDYVEIDEEGWNIGSFFQRVQYLLKELFMTIWMVKLP